MGESFERLRHLWKDNIKVNLKETLYKDVDWIRVGHWRKGVQSQTYVNTITNFRFHKTGNFLSSRAYYLDLRGMK
jgi:hypothetical protein